MKNLGYRKTTGQSFMRSWTIRASPYNSSN